MRRNSRTFFGTLSAGLFLLFLTGCAGIGDLFKSPTASIQSIEIVGLDFSGVSLQVNVAIDNPNPLGVTLNAYDYGLMVDGESVVKGRRDDEVSLKASGRSTLPVPVDISFQQLAGAASALKHQDIIPLSVALGLEIAIPYLGGIRLDLNGSVEIPSLRIPVVRPASIKVENINLSGADILLSLKVENPNGFALIVRNMEGSMKVGGNEWGRVGNDAVTSIPSRKAAEFKIRTRVDFVQVGRSAWSLLTGSGSAQVALDGTMDVDMDFPAFKGSGVKWDGDAKVSIIR
jgi:LEA14-like dessication related protein